MKNSYYEYIKVYKLIRKTQTTQQINGLKKKKNMSKHFTDGETHMNNKHMNRCSTSLVIKPQGNTTVPPLNCHKFKSLTISSVRGDKNPCEFLSIAAESLHLAVLFRRTALCFFKLNMYLPSEPATPLLDVYIDAIPIKVSTDRFCETGKSHFKMCGLVKNNVEGLGFQIAQPITKLCN